LQNPDAPDPAPIPGEIAERLQTQSAFSRRMGVSPSAVSLWVRKGMDGVYYPGGKIKPPRIDPVAADAWLTARKLDAFQQGQAAQIPGTEGQGNLLALDDMRQTQHASAKVSLETRQIELARARRAEALESGHLVEADAMRAALTTTLRSLNLTLGGLPDRIARRCGITDDDVLDAIIDEVSKALDAAAAELDAFAESDVGVDHAA
jgi:phage terminase Nu1 subunit (DNA packaging protein)